MLKNPKLRIHGSTYKEPAGTTCWCVESARSEAARYWAGYFWTDNIYEAIRLCREEDADKVKEQFSQFNNRYISVQQVWDDNDDTQ